MQTKALFLCKGFQLQSLVNFSFPFPLKIGRFSAKLSSYEEIYLAIFSLEPQFL